VCRGALVTPMWIADVAEHPKLKFGTKAVLFMISLEFDARGRPLYANKKELIEHIRASCPDVTAGYIERALKEGIDHHLLVREYHHADGYTSAIYRPRGLNQTYHGPDVYVASEDTATWTGALEVAEAREAADGGLSPQ
jgi:hypothetical protein